jgi:hypothetical protein
MDFLDKHVDSISEYKKFNYHEGASNLSKNVGEYIIPNNSAAELRRQQASRSSP